MKTKTRLTWVSVAFLSFSIACCKVVPDADPRLKLFAAQKCQQTEELAAQLHLNVLPEVRKFYRAAEAGDWNAVSNLYARIQRIAGMTNTSLCLPATNVLSVPIHETVGAYDTFTHWDGTLLHEYAAGILQSIPAGSVYFGGTDPGRFVITAFRDIANAPDIFIITPKFIVPKYGPVMSGNFSGVISGDLGTGYLDYLRLLYGGRLSVPAETDGQAAIQQYAKDFKERRASGEPVDPDEDVGLERGRVQVHGAKAAMNIDAIITQWIFDHNKDKHEFYIEESFVIPWMFPYLEPHGLILKVNKEPRAQFDPGTIRRDRDYWDQLIAKLLADPHFRGNEMARKTYSKMRSAIGGVYAYRKLYEDAEYAYRQSIQLCSDSPEANFRTSQLLLEIGRHDEAITVLQQVLHQEPTRALTHYYLAKSLLAVGRRSEARTELRTAVTQNLPALEKAAAEALLLQP